MILKAVEYLWIEDLPAATRALGQRHSRKVGILNQQVFHKSLSSFHGACFLTFCS